MGDYNTVNEEIRAQREKVKKMPWYKQLGHYWHYNKWIIISIVLGTFFVVSLIKSAMEHRYSYMTGVLMNSYATEAQEKSLEEMYIDAFEINMDDYTLDFDCTMNYYLEDPTDVTSINTPAKMVAYSEGKVGDFFICDAETYDFFAKNGYFADLSQELPDDLIAKYQDRFYYYNAYDGRGEIPMAIRLETPEIFKTFDGYADDEELLFSIFYNGQHTEQALEFLTFIFETE